MKRIEVDGLDGRADAVMNVVAGSAGGVAGMDPVGGFVAGSLESTAFDEGLREDDGMTVFVFPVGGEAAEGQGENMAGEMRDLDPWRDKKAHVVDDEFEVLLTLLVGPSDELVSGGGFPRGGAEEQGGDRTALGVLGEIGHALPDARAESEIVVTMEKRSPEIGDRSAFDDGERDGRQRLELAADGRVVMGDRLKGSPSVAVDVVETTRGGQFDQPALIELSEHGSARHVLEASGGVAPVPEMSEFFGQTRAVPIRVVADQPSDFLDMARFERSALDVEE